jgi:hypothetical protein
MLCVFRWTGGEAERWILKFGRDILSRDKRHKGCIAHYQSITADVIVLGRFGYLGELREGTLKALTDHLEGGWEYTHSFDPYWLTGGSDIFLSYFKGPSSQDQQKTFRRRWITFKVTLTGHFDWSLYADFFDSVRSLYAVTSTPIKWPPHTQASVPPPPWTKGEGGHTLLRLRGRGSQFGRLEKNPSSLSTLCYVQKKHNNRQMNPTVQYTVYTEHIDSVQSLYAVTPTPYHECTQLVHKILVINWIKVTWRSQQTAYIHSTELVWPRTFMVRSWCDRVKWLYGAQKSA